MRRSLLIGSVLAVAVAPSGAHAATVVVDARAGHLIYQATPGERNNVRIAADARGVRIVDSVPIIPGKGCARPEPRRGNIVRCEYRGASLSRPVVRLGDANDSATISGGGAFFMGGPGDDDLTGGRGPDVLAGGQGDDRMRGAGGSDVFDEDNADNGSDVMLGGDGPDGGPLPAFDRVDYGARRHSVRADLSGDRDDGERGERDRIGADVEGLGGGRGDDSLTGNARRNQLAGRRGTDALAGGGGSDRLFAGGGATTPAATSDSLDGGAGSDQLFGSEGANLMAGGPDADVIYSDDGRDTVLSRDGAVDVVHCGRGDDFVRSDPFEFLLSCERGSPPSSASPVPLDLKVADSRTNVSLTIGCRENHPASCTGTVQLELAGETITPEVAFSGLNRHRYVLMTEVTQPLPPQVERREDFVVRVRSHSATGEPTNDAFPVPRPLTASLLF